MKATPVDSVIQIRRARLEEVETIALVLHASFIEFKAFYTSAAFAATTPTSNQIRERWSEGPVWIAIQNGDIVGTVAAVPKSSGLYVRSMAVHPSARGQGIARQLLQEIESFAVKHHHRRLFLSTTPFLKEAIRLYEHFGFQRSDEGQHELFGTPLFTMVKRLEPMERELRNPKSFTQQEEKAG